MVTFLVSTKTSGFNHREVVSEVISSSLPRSLYQDIRAAEVDNDVASSFSTKTSAAAWVASEIMSMPLWSAAQPHDVLGQRHWLP